ncbi:hypothetical protein AGMMS49941_13160 [Deferribacterales bacterium]|nr:hypothetical protein AGMMS49941_13160 [Deferribacterales bacterium]
MVSACASYDVAYKQPSQKIVGLWNDIIVGKDYIRFLYDEDLVVNVMLYGITEKALTSGKVWIVVSFSPYTYKPRLKKKYYFDVAGVSTNVGTMSLSKSYPIDIRDIEGRLDLKEVLNATSDGRLFIEYDVTLSDWYKAYLKDANKCVTKREQKQQPIFLLEGLYNRRGTNVDSKSIAINTCELETKGSDLASRASSYFIVNVLILGVAAILSGH